MKYILYSIGVVLLCGDVCMARSLSAYRSKRDFKKTKEPAGKKQVKSKRPIFVIQQHAARAMHYDFRIEVNGVLVSWAVPKGPSLNPKVKRLAVMTEDHPIEYAKFEGIIPKGEYGAGPVIVWDRGTYTNIRKKDGKLVSMSSCIKNGEIEIFLRGKKIKGGFSLIRMKQFDGEKSQWLLIKKKDEYADARRNPVSSQSESVKTGKTIKEWRQKQKAMEKRSK